jgi:proline iminopeptidase
MTRKAGVLAIALLFSAGMGLRVCPAAPSSQTVVTHANSTVPPQVEKRERAMDRVVHTEENIIREIPRAPRWCDGMDIRKEKVDVGDCKLYCEQEGRGTPLVLLHGGPGATHHYFHPYFSQAGDFARVIYYDQRGCGLSDFQAGKGYRVDQAADDLDRLRQALGMDKWVVLGHSYGGLLAQCYALRYPESLKGLILLCASTGLHDSSGPSRTQDFLSPEERQKISQIRRTSGLSTAQIVYNNFLNGDWKRQSYYKPSRERIAQIALYEWVQDRNFNGIMSRSAAAVNLEGAFSQCPIPTLIMEAKWDMSWSTDKPERFRENHPHAQFDMFEESGHSPFEDEPARFFGILKDFIGSLPPVSAEKLGPWKASLAAWRQDQKPHLPPIKTSLAGAGQTEPKPPDGSSAQGTSGPPTAGAPGTNRVLDLDGKTSFVQVADSPSLHTFTNAITIETWFKAASLDTREGMINSLLRKNVAAGGENFLLRFRAVEGNLCVQMSPGYDLGALSARYSFDTGRWYHLAGVYDGNSITVYVNGTRIGSQSASGRMYIDQSDLFIGKGDPEFPEGEYFHGWLDEIRLWNVARAPQEIRATMNTPLTGKENGLVAYWTFDDGTARDLSGHGNDGLVDRSSQATPESFVDTDVSPRERAAIELLNKTKTEILGGRKFNDLSTPGGAFLTFIAACRHEDPVLFDRATPAFRDFGKPSEAWSRLLDGLIKPAVVRRVETGNETPQESDICSIYTSQGPDADIGQVWSFGYVAGAWRFLNCTVPTDTWMSHARKNESRTREILQKTQP